MTDPIVTIVLIAAALIVVVSATLLVLHWMAESEDADQHPTGSNSDHDHGFFG